MIRTVITPRDHTICIPVSSDYIGKKLEVLLYASDELEKNALHITKGNAARFKGILTEDEAVKYHQHLQRARQEWDRSI